MHGSMASETSPASATLEPEAAERCASAFIPAWQFDSAPFVAREEQLSSSDLEELSSGTAKSEGPELPTPTPRASPPAVVAPLPSTFAFDDGDEVVFRSRPRKGLLIGVGVAAGVAAILTIGIAWTRAATPAPSTPLTPSATLTQAAADVPIPPPPPPSSDVTAATAIPSPAPPPQEAPSAPPSASHRATATQRAHAPGSAHPSRNPLPPQKSTSKATAGLVRDNPF
jgi:hypothetical protein